ncbi:MAG: hypothetical protein ACRDPE_11345 [Solirubrobacterales bacterium]
MGIKKIGLTLVVVTALAAVMASSALGAATTGKSQWYVGGVALANNASKEVTCKSTGNLTLEGTVLGLKTKLTATGVECVESKIEQVEVENAKKEKEKMAIDSGKLRFTGVTVDEPEGCSVTGGTVTTEKLNTFVQMDGAKVYDKFQPALGETFVKIPITGCAIAGNIPVTGTDFGLATHLNAKEETVNNLTGEEFAQQMLTFSGKINEEAGGALKLGGNTATLTGTADNEVVEFKEVEGKKVHVNIGAFGAKEN